MSESTESTTQAEVSVQAIRSLRRKRDLSMHLVAFLIVLGALWVVWAVMAVQLDIWFPWPVFPTVGWGIGRPCTPGLFTDRNPAR